jgi:nucleotide-binding universal stress UspA family protein
MKERLQLLTVVGEEESTRDLIRFAGIVVLGFEADITFLAVSPPSRQEFSVTTEIAKEILSDWGLTTPATARLAAVEEWLVRYRMVQCDREDRAISSPFRVDEKGVREKELRGVDGQAFRLRMRQGDLAEEVVMETREHDYGMIFLGVPEHWRKMAHVLQFSGPPTMVVRRWTSQEYRFLVCLDGSPASRRALNLVARIALVMVAPLDLVAVPEKGYPQARAEAELERAARHLRRAAVPHRTLLERGSCEQRILALADESTIVVLGASSRGQMWQLILGAKPYRIARRARGPVLIVK